VNRKEKLLKALNILLNLRDDLDEVRKQTKVIRNVLDRDYLIRQFHGAIYPELKNINEMIVEQIIPEVPDFVNDVQRMKTQLEPTHGDATDLIISERGISKAGKLVSRLSEIIKFDTLFDIIERWDLVSYNFGAIKGLEVMGLEFGFNVQWAPYIKKENQDIQPVEPSAVEEPIIPPSKIPTTVIWNFKDEEYKREIMERYFANRVPETFTTTTWKQVGEAIHDTFYVRQMGVSEAIGRIEKLKSEEITRQRARLIARTESAQLSGKGTYDAYRKSGMKLKRWLNVGDQRVRHQHVQNGLQDYIDINEPYWDGSMHVPGVSPFNCRCAETAKLGDGAFNPWDGS
jgi:hypothetical protein